ncbi:Flp family type IVb pilin [Fontivita pretiosa]|uniref:Flp family type IVb pilin n=1 Tax=Fontivita pretiosa TaxID=2989684 RepID=UPI003D17B1F8
MFKRFVREEQGATMVEYGLMVALIAVVCILVVAALGQELGQAFDTVQVEVRQANDTANQVQPTP